MTAPQEPRAAPRSDCYEAGCAHDACRRAWRARDRQRRSRAARGLSFPLSPPPVEERPVSDAEAVDVLLEVLHGWRAW